MTKDAEVQPDTGGSSRAEYSVLLVFESRLLDRFLLVRHESRGWELPGGHVEAGEGPSEGARREWEEETGLPLAVLECVGRHLRPDGSMGHLFLGAMRDSGGPGQDQGQEGGREGAAFEAVDPKGRIKTGRWVRRLNELNPLSFPGDPYDGLARIIWDRARADGVAPDMPGSGEWRSAWQRVPGETQEAFIKRLSAHPEAFPRGDPVQEVQDPHARSS